MKKVCAICNEKIDKEPINLNGKIIALDNYKLSYMLFRMGYKIDDRDVVAIKVKHDILICQKCYEENKLDIRESW